MDPTSTTQLAELENTFFAWEITDWNLTVYIHIYDKKLIVLNHEEQKPDVHISAELKSYINEQYGFDIKVLKKIGTINIIYLHYSITLRYYYFLADLFIQVLKTL